MIKRKKTWRIAMPAWEIGRVNTGLGVKIGGLGVIVEELPPELVKAAARQGIKLEIETLTPCFAHYDRSRLTPVDMKVPVTLDGRTFEFEVFKHTFPDGQTVIYFWDEWQLNWTSATAIYPDDPWMSLRLFATLSQAMAGYIKQSNFDTVHGHDYHVGLVPFYLGDAYLSEVPFHFTIHNATYQGLCPVGSHGYEVLQSLNLPGPQLFHQYFDFYDHINLMKGVLIKTHETGGKITTVSGDLKGTWGYAAELRESQASLYARAAAQKGGHVGEIFLPNRHLDVFEQLPVTGITNGLSDQNRPENLVELDNEYLTQLQARRGPDQPIFQNPTVQYEMLTEDHRFDLGRLHLKSVLKRLLHLEAFGEENFHNPILLTAVGRLVGQKNFGLIADIIEPVLTYDENTKFIILASAPDGDSDGKATENAFFNLAALYPQRVYFNNTFNGPLSKLIFAGGDFTLIPSRFEPCGLVDYEASLLGTVVIGRLTGGLAKVRHCAYLYDWLDISDRWGEANAFFQQIKDAIDTFRHNPARHWSLIQAAMLINSSWDKSADQYIEMYRYGQLMKEWLLRRNKLVTEFIKVLGDEEALFADFFDPADGPYGDQLNEILETKLESSP